MRLGLGLRLSDILKAGAAPKSTLVDDLVSYWPLGETSATRSDVVGANHLSDNNTVGYGTGVNGNAADMENGNQETLSIEDNASLSALFSTKLTVSLWLKPESVSNEVWLSRQPDLYAASTAGNHYFLIGGAYGYQDGTPLVADEWNHLVWIYDGAGADNAAKLKLYRNGEAITLGFNGTIPTSIPDTNPLTVLGGYSLSQFTWDGLMDEVGMWSRPLTADEAVELYNGGSGKFYNATTEDFE